MYFSMLQIGQEGWEPDLVLASNAKRTKQTLEEMATVITSLEDVDMHLMGWVLGKWQRKYELIPLVALQAPCSS